MGSSTKPSMPPTPPSSRPARRRCRRAIVGRRWSSSTGSIPPRRGSAAGSCGSRTSRSSTSSRDAPSSPSSFRRTARRSGSRTRSRRSSTIPRPRGACGRSSRRSARGSARREPSTARRASCSAVRHTVPGTARGYNRFVPRSMTGYGAAESSGAKGRFRAELRGINARFLEVRVRVPALLVPYDSERRRRLAETFRRGRLDLSVTFEAAPSADAPVRLHAGLAKAYLDAALALRRDLGLSGELGVADVLALPGVLEAVDGTGADPEMNAIAMRAVDAAAREVDGMRRAEGAATAADITARITKLSALREAVAARAGEVPAAIKRKLEERLRKLGVEAAVDPSRLAQEVAYLADKADIMEELARYEAHLARCRALLATDEPVGKTLEFLAQELHRETNTIGSKSSDALISGHVLEMKTEIERIREQVMNLE